MWPVRSVPRGGRRVDGPPWRLGQLHRHVALGVERVVDEGLLDQQEFDAIARAGVAAAIGVDLEQLETWPEEEEEERLGEALTYVKELAVREVEARGEEMARELVVPVADARAKEVVDALRAFAKDNRITTDAEASRRVQKLFMDDAPWVFLYQPDVVVTMRKNVKGYVFWPDRYVRYHPIFKE